MPQLLGVRLPNVYVALKELPHFFLKIYVFASTWLGQEGSELFCHFSIGKYSVPIIRYRSL